ncbi:MAG: PDZ domain-containing protein [Nostocales cyanobacterium]|nr:MAG: PDZ domain-containing protein [Nostocales cyanobacterium]TAF19235.1 MAG: PDZ domain-containing protein [Nostocales cyanobacterium]
MNYKSKLANSQHILDPLNTRKRIFITKLGLLTTGLTAILLSSCSTLNSRTLEGNKNNTQAQTNSTTNNTTNSTPNPVFSPPAIIAATGNPNFVVDVVQKVGGAVVRIDSAKTVSTVPDGFDDPFFRRFFGDRIPRTEQRVERGSGSGFIIDASGQILTNSHVVDGADKVTVTLKDGRTFDGQVLGEDPITDVAVIKINANNLPTLALGNSSTLQPGEAVIAIGNPLGLNNTVTSGIISATDRSSSDIGASDKRVDYLQTDAAINPGNSGGPLLNARGEVIGMNTAIIQGAQGLGFAIPINTVQKISQELISKGRVDHPYLGIQMVTLTPEVKERIRNRFGDQINLSADKGVLLVRIVPQSPAAQDGLRAGDVITAMNNQPVTKVEDVQKIVENSQVGNSLPVEVNRNGRTINLAVTPAPLPIRGNR